MNRSKVAGALASLRCISIAAAGALLLLAMAGNAFSSKGESPTVMLALHGFNYTDLTISYFAVNGVGGGNIFVSSPSTGGGKTSCCVMWATSTALPAPIHVEWMRRVDGKDRWCDKTIQLTGPVPERPSHFSVHFMPDGNIQVELTADYPSPKIHLEHFSDGRRKATGNAVHDEEVARCRNER